MQAQLQPGIWTRNDNSMLFKRTDTFTKYNNTEIFKNRPNIFFKGSKHYGEGVAALTTNVFRNLSEFPTCRAFSGYRHVVQLIFCDLPSALLNALNKTKVSFLFQSSRALTRSQSPLLHPQHPYIYSEHDTTFV